MRIPLHPVSLGIRIRDNQKKGHYGYPKRYVRIFLGTKINVSLERRVYLPKDQGRDTKLPYLLGYEGILPFFVFLSFFVYLICIFDPVTTLLPVSGIIAGCQ